MIRFIQPNHYRKQVGDTVDTFPYGVEELLVRRGIAEFVDEVPMAAAVVTEPVAEQPKRRKPRRTQETEA